MIARIKFVKGADWTPNVDETYAEIGTRMLVDIYNEDKKLIRSIPLSHVEQIIYSEE